MYMHNTRESKTKAGAASLFIVVFSILLLTIISLSFIKIALRGARTATENDLSQSAYDSAMSGVEDAKRAVVKYTEGCILSNSLGDDKCNALRTSYAGGSCDVVAETLGASVVDEQKLTPGGGGHDSNQAYTCVKVTYNTDDYLGRLEAEDESVVVPLRAMGAVDRINISWFSAEDLSGQSTTINFPSDSTQLLTDDQWTQRNLPPIMVAQYFKIADLNQYDIYGSGSFHTLYLTPAKVGLNSAISFRGDDVRGVDAVQTVPLIGIKCNNNVSNSVYACSAEIMLPEVVPANSNQHYIRLSKRYSTKANYQVRMQHGSNVVKFAGVQPAVDSNGRANDFFRRVESRLNLSTVALNAPTLPYGAVEVAKGDFCKSLIVNN